MRRAHVDGVWASRPDETAHKWRKTMTRKDRYEDPNGNRKAFEPDAAPSKDEGADIESKDVPFPGEDFDPEEEWV